MAVTPRKSPASRRADAGPGVLGDWLESLTEFGSRAVAVLGPDPFAANDSREVIAVFPEVFRPAANSIARSEVYGAEWRKSRSPLVAWKNLSGAGAEPDAAWIAQCTELGVMSLVRAEFQMPFGQSFECFTLGSRELTDRGQAASIAWAALSVWPLVREHVIAERFQISPREREVLLMMAQSSTARETALRLGWSERTVNFHWANVMAKLRADHKTVTIQRACTAGLLS